MKATLVMSMLLSASVATAQDVERNLETTAASIVLKENPFLSYSDEEFIEKRNTVKRQVEAILNTYVKEEYREEIYRPLPFEAGSVMVGFKENSGVVVSVENGRVRTNNIGLNPILEAYGATAAEEFGDSIYMISFSRNENPNVVAKEIMELDKIVEFSEANALYQMGGLTISRLSWYLYQINVGWGDCPAGCIYNNRTYVEAKNDGERREVELNYIGRGGDDLEEDMEDPIQAQR